jgi:hypothetical protein
VGTESTNEKRQRAFGQLVATASIRSRILKGVYHKEHTELVGTIIKHERHESGRISPIPFYVLWDNGEWARGLLGLMHWYADANRVEPIEEEGDED